MTTVPVWRSLSQAAKHRYSSCFMHIAPSAIAAVNEGDLAFLIQWVFEQHGIEVKGAILQNGKLDLILVHDDLKHEAFARVYCSKRGTPTNALYDLLETLEGTNYGKIFFCTVSAFSPAQKRIHNKSPLLLEIKEGDRLAEYVREAQVTYREELMRRSSQASRARKGPSLSKWIKRFIQSLIE